MQVTSKLFIAFMCFTGIAVGEQTPTIDATEQVVCCSDEECPDTSQGCNLGRQDAFGHGICDEIGNIEESDRVAARGPSVWGLCMANNLEDASINWCKGENSECHSDSDCCPPSFKGKYSCCQDGKCNSVAEACHSI